MVVIRYVLDLPARIDYEAEWIDVPHPLSFHFWAMQMSSKERRMRRLHFIVRMGIIVYDNKVMIDLPKG